MPKNKNTFEKWRRIRGYRHFDRPSCAKHPPSPKDVATHSFFPLLRRSQSERRYKRESKKVVAKVRDLRYASHGDARIYAYYSEQLSEIYEIAVKHGGLEDCVLAYRKFPNGACNIHHAKAVFDYINQMENCDVITTDVKDFFDSIDHTILKSNWMKLLQAERLPADHFAVFKQISQYRWVDLDDVRKELGIKKSSFKRESIPGQRKEPLCSIASLRKILRIEGLVNSNDANKGIPQGSPISALLSNIYMIEFDRALLEFAIVHQGVYRRYSDDILLIAPKGKQESAMAFLQTQLEKVSLSLHPKKTTSHEFRKFDGNVLCSKPLQYLGFEYDGKCARIRSRTLSVFLQRMKRAVKRGSSAALSAKSPKLLKRKLFERYSHLGKRNFISYAKRSMSILYPNQPENPIRRQISRFQTILMEQVRKEERKLTNTLGIATAQPSSSPSSSQIRDVTQKQNKTESF